MDRSSNITAQTFKMIISLFISSQSINYHNYHDSLMVMKMLVKDQVF